jgi:hypothetical protein
MRRLALTAILQFGVSMCVLAQSPTATLSGRVLDPTQAAIAGASITAINGGTNEVSHTTTNNEGFYTIVNLPPGPYRLEVTKPGFKALIKPHVILHVQDVIAINFKLSLGAVSESITVEGGAPLVDTESAAVSTVVDRQFAENLPMNGRSFQTLIQLTPGVVLTPATATDTGQFSVNGQRAVSNYWMVDGVSANIGMSTFANPSNSLGGTVGSSNVLGGTNSLVSIDALQEFRIQTSTFAPEFGRTPGAQISIVTRSGTNQFHGALFDYLRNDVLDASNWFNGTTSPPLPKAKERQNDFGGTFSGPILKDRTFFFFSYEALRLRLPQTELTNVPDPAARQSAGPAMQPFLNAYPLPNGPENPAIPGAAQFNSSFSNPATLDAYSLRIDHKLASNVNVFGRYNYSPSRLDQRGSSDAALSNVSRSRITTQTGTAGLTWALSPETANEFRFNYSSTSALSNEFQDNFGGAVAPPSFPFPAGFSETNSDYAVQIDSLGSQNGAIIGAGKGTQNLQRQINVVDNFSTQKGPHAFKFGIDFRRLTPRAQISEYVQTGEFVDVPGAETGNTAQTILQSRRPVTLSFRNLGVFAQDTWRISPRLNLTYGIRWDVDFAPGSISGPAFPSVAGFNLNNLSNLNLAPAGTPAFKTPYGNVAPRIGVAYQLWQNSNWQTVLRGGFGVFYDLTSAEAGNVLPLESYPYGAVDFLGGTAFPLTGPAGAPPQIIQPSPGTGEIFAFDPNLRLPYTLEWNGAIEQGLGSQQTVSFTYVGSAGRRLLQTEVIVSPNANNSYVQIVTNAPTSNYNALQVRLERRLSRGFQALASYSWSHSIDTASASSVGNLSNLTPGGLNPNTNRGPSDFDIRNAFSAGITYDVPAPRSYTLANAILHGWSLQTVVQARSAAPVNVSDTSFVELSNGIAGGIRPDSVAGQPFYLHGSQYPGGEAFNPAAFADPPYDPSTFIPLRQGSTPRNSLRGFGATQWDFAAHRDFPVYESLKLQFRAEMFNILNHPNFGPPSGMFVSPALGGPAGFGLATQMLGQSLVGPLGLGGGAFDPLYQIGGPRSIQFALKVMF